METNVAAWMIAGGNRALDPAELRNQIHVRAIRAAAPERATLTGRITAAVSARLATLRPAPTPSEPACCPA
jgi:hypothetical protein